MEPVNEYIIEGGTEGKKRLDVLSELLDAGTIGLINRYADLQGQAFLDVGCGGGNLSLAVAKLTGKEGRVTGVDFDPEIIALAKAAALEQGVTNVDYQVADAYDIAFKEAFDIAYSRFLLSHLTKPAVVISQLLQALKPGGSIIIEDIDFSGHYSFPYSHAFNSYLDYFTRAATNNGQHPNVGLSLFSLFQEAGIEHIAFDVVQPAYNTGAGKWMAYYTMDKIKAAVVRQGLATAGEIDALLERLKAYTEDPKTIISLPRIFRVRGTKKH